MASPHPAVRVVWIDSGMHIDHGWDTLEVYRKDTGPDRMEVTTVGLLVSEDEDSLLVALNHDVPLDTYLGMQLIARSNVISTTLLTGPDGT